MVAGIFQSVLKLAAVPANLTELFGPSLSPEAQILHTSEDGFSAKLTQRWSAYNAPSYIGAIKPATEQDIQKIVQIAASNNIPFLTTGGGHGTDDFHNFHGLSIDLSNFRAVDLDAETNRLTIGGSTKIHQIDKLLYDAGKEFPLGSCACVGIVGATLGGGIGSLMGHRGLMSDATESVRIVTADGNLIEASESLNEDLFWALRGAGSNFGIVTSATYKVYDITNRGEAVNADFVYPASVNGSFWNVMREYDSLLPARLALTAVSFYDRVHEQPVIAVNAVFFGTQEDGEPYLEPLKSLNPVRVNISTVPGDQLMDAAFFNFFGQDNGACTPNQHINIYTLGLKQIDPPTFTSFYAKLNDFWIANPDYQGRLLLQKFPNHAVRAVPDDKTAFGNRDVTTYMNIEGFYTDPALDDAVNAFSRAGRAEFAETSGYDSLVTYSNYAHGDEGPEAWYRAHKLSKLSELKRKWDKDGLFSHNYPVPVESSGRVDL